MLAGVLEREKTPPSRTVEPEPDDSADPEPTPTKGRGGNASARARASSATTKRTTKPRTIHLPDDLFERILVQSHRRDKTISEYVAALLDRHVPDHRVVRSAGSADSEEAA